MTSEIRMWIEFIKRAIARRMAYRLEYFLSLITMFTLELIGPIFAYVIYFNSQGFEGWTFYEIILIQGILLTVKGFSFSTFFGIVWNTNMTLRRGTFDFILLKPRNHLFTFICESFDAEDIAKFVGGIIISAYAISHIGDITINGLILMMICIIFGVALFFATALLFSAFLFHVIQTWRVYELLDIVTTLGQYPNTIYPKAASGFFTVVFPIFIASVFPVNALMGEITKTMIISAISTIVLTAISLFIWFRTIKIYASAGG